MNPVSAAETDNNFLFRFTSYAPTFSPDPPLPSPPVPSAPAAFPPLVCLDEVRHVHGHLTSHNAASKVRPRDDEAERVPSMAPVRAQRLTSSICVE